MKKRIIYCPENGAHKRHCRPITYDSRCVAREITAFGLMSRHKVYEREIKGEWAIMTMDGYDCVISLEGGKSYRGEIPEMLDRWFNRWFKPA